MASKNNPSGSFAVDLGGQPQAVSHYAWIVARKQKADLIRRLIQSFGISKQAFYMKELEHRTPDERELLRQLEIQIAKAEEELLELDSWRERGRVAAPRIRDWILLKIYDWATRP